MASMWITAKCSWLTVEDGWTVHIPVSESGASPIWLNQWITAHGKCLPFCRKEKNARTRGTQISSSGCLRDCWLISMLTSFNFLQVFLFHFNSLTLVLTFTYCPLVHLFLSCLFLFTSLFLAPTLYPTRVNSRPPPYPRTIKTPIHVSTLDLRRTLGPSRLQQNSARGGSKTCKTPLKLSKATGKESNSTVAFLELNWGTATHDYYLSIKKRGPQYTADIIIMARQTPVPQGPEPAG